MATTFSAPSVSPPPSTFGRKEHHSFWHTTVHTAFVAAVFWLAVVFYQCLIDAFNFLFCRKATIILNYRQAELLNLKKVEKRKVFSKVCVCLCSSSQFSDTLFFSMPDRGA